MMRRLKGWALLVVGALVFALGFISAANFSFDGEFIMPSSIILAALLIPAGGDFVCAWPLDPGLLVEALSG